MSERLTYHLAGKRGSWSVWHEGQTQPVLQTRTKREEIDKARALAKQCLARLLVHHEKGGVVLDLTFYSGALRDGRRARTRRT